MDISPSPSAAPRSNFVNVLAWLSIALTGLMTFVALLQFLMVGVVWPQASVSPLPTLTDVQGMPAFVQLIVANLARLMAGFLAVSTVALTSSIGLLNRKEWARLLFIVFLALGIVWNVGGLVIQEMIFRSDVFAPARSQPEFRAMFDGTMRMIRVISWVTAGLFSAIHIWIIVRLCSARIRAEFRAER